MSAEPQNQLQDHSESAATSCPLEPSMFLEALRSTGLRILEEIEKHVSASQCHHPPLKDLTLHGSLDGTTPLLLACYYGNLDCVKHLVENWGVDLQAAAVYYSDPLCSWGEIGVATPLFVAAQKCHFEIIKYLVEKGGNVNGKGSRLKDVEETLLQVLFAFSKYLDIRKNVTATALLLLESGADPNVTDGCPIWMNRLCDTVITTALVQHGLKLDQRNEFGETILHHRAKQDRWSFLVIPGHPEKCDRAMTLIKLLVDNGADLMARDNKGFTPILAAAVNGSWPVLDYMLELDEITGKEKIDALEMAAARILSSNDWDSDPEQAFAYLREALRLRQIGQLHMTPLKLKRGRTIGWTTEAELDQVIEEPDEYLLQSYLIQLRILSDGDRSHGATISLCEFLDDCIFRLYEQQNSLDNYVDVLWATFEKIQLCLSDTHHENGLWRMADYVAPKLIYLILYLGEDDPLYTTDTFRSILKMVLVTDRLHSGFFPNKYYKITMLPIHMDTLLDLFTYLAGLPEEILNDVKEHQELSIKYLLSQLVFQKSRNLRGQLLLHMACDADKLDIATIRLLLQVNADPNAGDKYGDGPLHVLASSYGLCLRCGNGQELLVHRTADAAHLLLQNGAHLDRVNQERKTAADVWKEKSKSQDLPLWLREPGSVPKLKCLTARIISSNKIAVTEENSPETPPVRRMALNYVCTGSIF